MKAKRKDTVVNPVLYDEAWKYHPGPSLLLAGPGTGKTHQLALRIKDLVENRDVSPESITVITFTVEAAGNMRRRISDDQKPECFIESKKRPSNISTMHSLGNKIIRENHQLLDLSEDFQVLTDPRLRSVLYRDAAMLSDADEKDAKEAERMRMKGQYIEPTSIFHSIIAKYMAILRLNNLIDYDDQILLACSLLHDNNDLKEEYSEKIEHLLVDEYQDINPDQRALIELLSQNHPEGLFVVGDDDQSIYSFRGGTPEYVRKFRNEFGDTASVLGLAKSWRCCENILLSSLDIVTKYDKQRISKPNPVFQEEKQGGAAVTFHNSATDDQEANVICQLVQKAIPKQNVLILVPARQYADKIKEQLRRRKVPYDAPPNLDDSGLLSFLTAYEWRANPENDCALRLCIDILCESSKVNIPGKRARKDEKKKERSDKLRQIANLWGERLQGRYKSLWAALCDKAKTKVDVLENIHKKLATFSKLNEKDVDKYLAFVAREMEPWKSNYDFVKELHSWLNELQPRGHDSSTSVRIMTLQSAKGLEADLVCVIGLTEDILPREFFDSTQLEECARLVYVSTSRAVHELHLFHTRKRDASITFLKKSYDLKPSRFIDAIAKERINTKYHQAPSKMKTK